MLISLKNIFLASMILAAVCSLATCIGTVSSQSTRGASAYTPYDALAMLWKRQAPDRVIVWTAATAEAAGLLTSNAPFSKRPDWILCTQSVVAGLATTGKRVSVIATVYTTDNAMYPVFKLPKRPIAGSKSLYTKRSGLELGFTRFLEEAHVPFEDVQIPTVEKIGIPTIVSLLEKPRSEKDALDFAILIEPYITNLLKAHPKDYLLGDPVPYHTFYNLVVRQDDAREHRPELLALVREFLKAESTLAQIPPDRYRSEVWGRMKDGKPELLPELLTFKRTPMRLEIKDKDLRHAIDEDMLTFTHKYPNQMTMPINKDALVDPSFLSEIIPVRVLQ